MGGRDERTPEARSNKKRTCRRLPRALLVKKMLVHLIRRAQMVPVLVEKGEQSFPVFRQAGDRFLVLGAVFVGEHVDRRFGRRAGWRAVDFTKVCFHVGLDREGDLVQHIGGLMDPTPLMPGAGKDLLDRFPEAERPVADRKVRGDLETTLLDVDEKLTPTLRALAHPRLEADQLFLSLGRRADQHEHGFGGVLHPRLQVDPVRPHIHVSPRREIAPPPDVVISLPLRRQPRDHRGRQVGRVLAQQGGERLLKIAGRHSAQVKRATARRGSWSSAPTSAGSTS